MNEKILMASTMFLAASVTGAKGEGLHTSPVLVAKAVDLAELLIAELEQREESKKIAAEKAKVAEKEAAAAEKAAKKLPAGPSIPA